LGLATTFEPHSVDAPEQLNPIISVCTQIRFVILLSRQGKVRLSKWYLTLSQKERAKIIKEVTPMVLSRAPKLCNFIDYKDSKLVYRRYASLYFVAGIDAGTPR
jgi:AP-1 complex subunit sigma 1/2